MSRRAVANPVSLSLGRFPVLDVRDAEEIIFRYRGVSYLFSRTVTRRAVVDRILSHLDISQTELAGRIGMRAADFGRAVAGASNLRPAARAALMAIVQPLSLDDPDLYSHFNRLQWVTMDYPDDSEDIY